MVVAMIFATNVVAEESIDRTQPYQMMTQVSEVAFNRLKAEQENIKQDPELLKSIPSLWGPLGDVISEDFFTLISPVIFRYYYQWTWAVWVKEARAALSCGIMTQLYRPLRCIGELHGFITILTSSKQKCEGCVSFGVLQMEWAYSRQFKMSLRWLDSLLAAFTLYLSPLGFFTSVVLHCQLR